MFSYDALPTMPALVARGAVPAATGAAGDQKVKFLDIGGVGNTRHRHHAGHARSVGQDLKTGFHPHGFTSQRKKRLIIHLRASRPMVTGSKNMRTLPALTFANLSFQWVVLESKRP
jgi:hypothetical protein